MKKFLTLVKKELKELLTPQVLLPMFGVVILFVAIGSLMSSEQEKTKDQAIPISVVDKDESVTSDLVIKTLEEASFEPVIIKDESVEVGLERTKEENRKALIIIPAGFEDSISGGEIKKIETYTVLKNFSFLGSKDSQILNAAIAALNEYFSDQIISTNAENLDPKTAKNPIQTKQFVMVGDKYAEGNPETVLGFVSSQTTFIPIILFLVIIVSAQMIATAVASEKENKTLETLLSAPVSRNTIVLAKMVGAGIVALITAVIYMFGFRYYMNGISGGELAQVGKLGELPVIDQLGLNFTTGNYILLGGSLFLGILAALAIALIIGAFAEDSKSVQGLISPLMIMLMIPYFLVMFLDFSSLSPMIQYIVYAIPFSHPFLAAPNILLGNYMPVVYGMFYELVFFVVFVYIAAKIFSTDKIITAKINFGKKKDA